MFKKLPDTNLNVVVRVVFETDNSKLKNSNRERFTVRVVITTLRKTQL